MAITTQAQYRSHVTLALKQAFQAQPRAALPLLPSLLTYAQVGADEREAMEMFIKWLWTQAIARPFSGHAIKHWLAEHGIATQQDFVDRNEP